MEKKSIVVELIQHESVKIVVPKITGRLNTLIAIWQAKIKEAISNAKRPPTFERFHGHSTRVNKQTKVVRTRCRSLSFWLPVII